MTCYVPYQEIQKTPHVTFIQHDGKLDDGPSWCEKSIDLLAKFFVYLQLLYLPCALRQILCHLIATSFFIVFSSVFCLLLPTASFFVEDAAEHKPRAFGANLVHRKYDRYTNLKLLLLNRWIQYPIHSTVQITGLPWPTTLYSPLRAFSAYHTLSSILNLASSRQPDLRHVFP